jgi:hypothetical protein
LAGARIRFAGRYHGLAWRPTIIQRTEKRCAGLLFNAHGKGSVNPKSQTNENKRLIELLHMSLPFESLAVQRKQMSDRLLMAGGALDSASPKTERRSLLHPFIFTIRKPTGHGPKSGSSPKIVATSRIGRRKPSPASSVHFSQSQTLHQPWPHLMRLRCRLGTGSWDTKNYLPMVSNWTNGPTNLT